MPYVVLLTCDAGVELRSGPLPKSASDRYLAGGWDEGLPVHVSMLPTART